jgi:hypothetical protein
MDALFDDRSKRCATPLLQGGYKLIGDVTDRVVSRVYSSLSRPSLWAMNASERRYVIENMLGGNLPYGFHAHITILI